MNWKQKLTSRKFWAAVASFVALLVVAFGGTQNQAAQITAIIMAGATVVAYIVGEGMIDAASAGASVTINGDATITGAGDTATAEQQTATPPSAPIDKTNPAAPESTPTGAAAKALQSAAEAVQAAQKVVSGTAQTQADSKGAA